jgi:hypothetical protein
MKPITVTSGQIDLLIEALQTRAARLEAYGRAKPRSAGVNDRKAAAMRNLSIALKRYRQNGQAARNPTPTCADLWRGFQAEDAE